MNLRRRSRFQFRNEIPSVRKTCWSRIDGFWALRFQQIRFQYLWSLDRWPRETASKCLPHPVEAPLPVLIYTESISLLVETHCFRSSRFWPFEVGLHMDGEILVLCWTTDNEQDR